VSAPESRVRRLLGKRISSQPWLAAFALALGDLIALAVAMALAVVIRKLYGGEYEYGLFVRVWPVLLLFLGIFAAMGLYLGVAQSPADEIRRITQSCFLGYIGLGTITYLSGTSTVYSRGVYVIALLLSTMSVPTMRVVVRGLCCRFRWWGYATVVIGARKTGREVVANLQAQPGLGLRPIAVLAEDPGADDEIDGVPVLPIAAAQELSEKHRIPFAILAMPGAERARYLELIEREKELFPHLLVIPDLYGFSSLWVEAKDIGGMLGLEVVRRLLKPWPRFVKRTMDLALTIVGGLCILPLIALIGLAIKVDSRGPVFYRQKRLGTGGRHFHAWKFRSMHRDADGLLERYLSEHPELREEWERDRKLRDDPRVTRVGKLLRRTSLDELPQLWNVLKGEMSLVGPRPIVDAEIEKYGDLYKLYVRVRPGMTGLWQVSGRSETTYDERVAFDAYYVRNWSVWLDIYLIARTLKVVLLGRGAY